MIKLNSVARWRYLATDSAVELSGGEDERLIRLYVNSPGRARLYLLDESDEPRFLAAPNGCEEVEFYASGVVRVGTPDKDVWFHTAELEPTYTIIENAESYTGPMNRATRNPEIELMNLIAEQNMQRRLAEVDALIEERLRYDPTRPTVIKSEAPGGAGTVVIAPEPDGRGAEDSSDEREAEPSAT